MTLKDGSSEELRRVLNHIRVTYDIPFWAMEKELMEMGCRVSLTTIYKFLIYEFPIPKSEKHLRKLVERLQQRYPEELLETAPPKGMAVANNLDKKTAGLPIVKRTP